MTFVHLFSDDIDVAWHEDLLETLAGETWEKSDNGG